MKTSFLIGISLLSVAPAGAAPKPLAPAPRALWKLPRGGHFDGLLRRPIGKIAVYWSTDTLVKGHHTFPMRRVLIEQKSGRVFANNSLPGLFVAPDVEKETFNARGQHAFLPQCNASVYKFLQLKSGGKYRTLFSLPRFGSESLQDLKFSPDGEVLKVLSRERLWIVGAQSGKLLRIIKPNQGKWWSRENAVLSPDGFTILAMREKMMLFSARTGRLMKRFGIHLETFTGGCGSVEARVDFSPDGRSALATSQDMNDYEALEFPAFGGRKTWQGRLPYNLRYSRGGHFYLDFKWSPDRRTQYPVVKSGRSHRIVAAFPALRFDDTFETPIEFSDDARAIFWVRNGILWRAPFHPRGS